MITKELTITKKLNISIIPLGKENKKKAGVFQNRIYLHGTLERECGYDLTNFDKRLKRESGIYQINKYNDKEIILFLWETKYKAFIGLVIHKSDKQAYQYAQKKFESKSPVL